MKLRLLLIPLLFAIGALLSYWWWQGRLERSQDGPIRAAAKRYGYRRDQVELRLYVGRFAGRTRGEHEERIRAWCRKQKVGTGPIKVIGLDEVVARVRQEAESKQYRDNPVLVTLKVLHEARVLEPEPLRLEVGRELARAARLYA